jgi:sulfopyruvate decarboxylase TPP-binding subunit
MQVTTQTFGFKSLQSVVGESIPTDADLLDKYLEMGISDIISVPCSITDTWQWLAASKAKANKIALTMSNHESNLPGIAAGKYFASGKPALVHMQNSGLFNAADGFVSFVNKAMFNIPMAVLVTYRGFSKEDNSEPHQEIGNRTDDLVNIIFGKENIFDSLRRESVIHSVERSVAAAQDGEVGVLKLDPFAFRKSITSKLPEKFPTVASDIIRTLPQRKGDDSKPTALRFNKPISRDQAIEEIINCHPNAAVIFANGYNSRAAYAICDRPGNFYNIGYMGGTLAIGWGLAKSNKNIEVVVVDGDQNAQMSSMKDHIADDYPENLHWYILNNHIGASVGTAESIPLSPFYYGFARVIETSADEPGTFKYPRVNGEKAMGEYIDSSNDAVSLSKISERFRYWIDSVS